ncbi:hypothetical protein UCDDA912_g05106 [Diaporthe ampelina]|uniref:Uncharacterized protein n=1 Tax=Diaporthe ampelina TaxID=1214573 RepID=A0A0G2FLL4_9PEZI|nr:hypothetical protein UCDDA912_g05106 [Diaporthe ampelina]
MAGVGNGHNIPRETARRNADSLSINYDALPQLPFWSPLFGRTNEDFKTRIAAKIMTSSASVGRELTQPEKDAMSYHFAKLLITMTYASPLAIAATAGFERATRSKYGFPFYNPKPQKFNPRKFPGLPEGKAKLAIGLVATSYAISVYSANSGSDNRLEAYRREIARPDEEKAYAKDQAQKEFDEMLERERRGQGR